MTRTAFILEDSTETLKVYPPMEWAGQASAATVRIGTPSTSMPAEGSGDAATVSSVSASTNAAAEENDTTLSFASDPGLTPGELYLISHDDLDSDFRVEVVSTGTTVRLKNPLPVDLPSGTTITGEAISHALTSAETANPGRALAIWTATIDGVSREWEQQFRIVPRAFSSRLSVPELEQLAPEFVRMRDPRDQTGQEAIDAAYEQLIHELEGQNYVISRINTIEKLNIPVAHLILWRRYRALEGPASENTLQSKRDFYDALDTAKAGSEFWYDAPDEDVLTDADRSHPTEHEIVEWVL